MHTHFFQRRTLLAAAISGVALSAAGCSPLAIINGLAPADTYRLSDGVAYGPHSRQRLDIYQPVHAAAAAPVVVFFYGGNWASGQRADYRFVGEALASKGYVAVLADYRLYPEVRFPGFLEDCALAVQWAFAHVAQYGGDPQRVFVMGHSAGAYNAAMLAIAPQYLRATGIKPQQLRGLITLAGPFDFLPLQSNVTKAVFGFPDTAITTQPIHYVTAAVPPALLITGSNDDVVDPGNSVRLAARLREHGATVREIVYPNVGHRTLVGALAAPLRSLAPVLNDVAGFINGLSDAPAAGALTRSN